MEKLTVEKSVDNNVTTFKISGRLDSITSPDFNDTLISSFDQSDSVVVDMEKLIYLSSAGLRVLLAGQKKANSQKKEYALKNVSGEMMELMDMIGFSDIINIQ